MVKEIQNKNMFMVPIQFSTVLFTDDAYIFFCWREKMVSVSDILLLVSGFV
jgi:hypothetical protein